MGQPRTAAIIVAAGQGVRAGGTLPKQFAMLAGKPMLAHSYGAMVSHSAIDEVLVVIAPGQEAALAEALGSVRFVFGGETRRESVRNGLAALPNVEHVLIHDAARPFLPVRVVDALIAALADGEAALPRTPGGRYARARRRVARRERPA